MPHSLYLGNGIIQARLEDFDRLNNHLPPSTTVTEDTHNQLSTTADDTADIDDRPNIAELVLCLFTFALVVKSAILVVAGPSLYNTPDAENADLFGIHALLASALALARPSEPIHG
ncbi:hypothetical protein B0A48_18840 [Cryoendolithus antarcticus]|uniref:Uncharacterized protein n=1 Tax=Cryoendolithus antarcticus TaxID=1507870 RepID=A0A1V8S7T9_9PEZI|nr:hypothetical protein B0A48_18845 [Cryoendolithus antarcticus]OQN95113.1 hypothetical protein B0A48_18840 [Cryoendolithus antarcticus]